jgi:hypothetical protein
VENRAFEFKQHINALVIFEIAKEGFGNNCKEYRNKTAKQILNSEIHQIIQLLTDAVYLEIDKLRKP